MKTNKTVCYMLVESTKFELPVDVALSLKELSIRHNIPLQTLKNRLCDGKTIKYYGVKVEKVII